MAPETLHPMLHPSTIAFAWFLADKVYQLTLIPKLPELGYAISLDI
jgi:hypothetical protein